MDEDVVKAIRQKARMMAILGLHPLGVAAQSPSVISKFVSGGTDVAQAMIHFWTAYNQKFQEMWVLDEHDNPPRSPSGPRPTPGS